MRSPHPKMSAPSAMSCRSAAPRAGSKAVALAEDLNPDVVLMDISMPGIGGAEATRRIKSANPGIHVIALSMHEESERGSEMLDAGATKYISKSRAASTIGDAIRSCCGSKIQDS